MPVSPKQTKKNTLKRRCEKVSILLFAAAFALSAGFFIVPEVSAATGVNKQINFQGKVVNTDGTNVTNGDYDFVFNIYSVDSGGTAIWTETRTGGNQVTVTDGIFQVNLGSVTALPGSVDFNTDNIYLGIEFNSDGEMSPRVRFTAAPYAMNADRVHGLTVTDTTGTLTIPNGETISFGGSFTTTASNDLTLTTSGATSVTLPTTGTLATLAGTEEFTNKTIGSTGLTFSGAVTDITTASGESLVIVAAGAGTVDIQDATTVDSLTADTGGISIAAGQSYTGAGAVTLSSATASDLTINSGTTGTISIGSDGSAETINIGTGVAVKTIVIGNSTDDSFTLNSSGLNVTSGGILTGVASIDTISVSSTALTFAGVGTLASGGSSGLTIDSASGVVSVATGDYLALSHSGVSGAAAGYIWYDSSDNKFKINENGTTKILCNTTDGGCGGGSSDLQTTYGNDADGSNVTISLTAADDGLIITNPTSSGNDLSSFTMQISQQNTTAAIKVLDLVQSSNAANAVDITANSIDTETGLSITANSLASGKGITVASSSTVFTGDLAGITLSGSSVSNTGNVFSVANTGTANANVSLFVDHRATGTNNLAVRINDESGDTTPFVIDGTGKVGIGTTAPSRAMDIVESASAPQLRLSKDLTYYSEMTVDSVGDLQISATGTDIRALSENIWVCDNDACPALTLTGDGNIFIENVLKFGNGVYLKNDSLTEISVYDNDDNAMLIFDEQ